ncbi:hypothetical protein ACFLSS_02115 [Bacteroidota bacterium]
MKLTSFYILILTSFILLKGLNGCKDEPVVNPPDQIEEGSWVRYSPYNWSHDGEPCISVFCKVYSDGASTEMKRHAGEFADRKFSEILQSFNFQNYSDFLYPLKNNKIDVYIIRFHEESIYAAFWGSILITVRNSVMDTTRLNYLFRHELTHAFEYLIEGTVNLGTDVWFREGIAIYVGSEGGWNYISNTDSLNSWRVRNSSFPNKGNPITIHQWENFPEGSDITGYYTVFDVVMSYLLDSNGLGKSLQDVLNLFYDVRYGASFSSAFQNNFGISLSDYENEIYNRLESYLNGNKSVF